jgi:hypothetical protein
LIEALVVMMNNYFHDLAVAFLFATSVMAHGTLRFWPGKPPPDMVRFIRRVACGALVWVLIGGAVRAWFYKEYEWLPKAGTAQVPALVVKHVVLVALTVWGLVGVVRLGRLTQESERGINEST